MSNEARRATLRVTKALSDPQRMRILMMLRAGELCACQIVEVLGLAPSTVSKHLSLLDAAGLLNSRKEGRWMYYQLPTAAGNAFTRPVLNWLRDALKRDPAIQADAVKLRRVQTSDPEIICRRQRKRSEAS